MKTTTIYINSLAFDACYTLGKIIAKMGWGYSGDHEDTMKVIYPEQDEDMFEFICGEFM